jgi:hypothetical protein
MAPKHSEVDLDLLTEEEREGLLADDIVDEGAEEGADTTDEADGDDASAAAAGGEAEPGSKDDAEPDAAAAKAGADPEAAVKAAADAEVAQAATDAAAAAAKDEGAAPTPAAAEEERQASWILPAEVGQKIDELEKARDAIVEQFDDGELTGKEMREKLKPLEKEMDQLKEQRTAANVQRDIAITTYKDVTVPAFFSAHPEYADKDSPLYGMLDATVRKLQQASRDPLSPQILERAHEQISGQLRKALGITEVPKPKTPAADPAKPVPKRDIPPTLANVPAADINDADDGGEFAYLDRLAEQDVEKYEAALGKMPDEARERYLSQ